MTANVSAKGQSATYLYQPTELSSTELNDWGTQENCTSGPSLSSGVLLYKSDDKMLESGFWRCTTGTWPLSIPRDEFCHFTSGKATYTDDKGDAFDVEAGTCVHFNGGWKGTCTVHDTMTNVYMLSGDQGEQLGKARVLHHPEDVTDVVDWGVIPTMIEGESNTSGIVLHKGSNGEAESGIWICTPGFWNCHVTKDEFCHFMSGRATYTHESGEVIEILPGTIAFFPKDWKGTCKVHEEVRKTYMIR